MKNNLWNKILAALLVVVIGLLVVLILAMNEKKPVNPMDNSNVVVVDDATEEYTETEEYSESDGKQLTYSSADLKWARLQGPVNTVVETWELPSYGGEKETMSTTLNFDKNGRLIPNSSKRLTYTRNSAGQITQEVEKDSEDGRQVTYTSSYQYNDKGYVKYESIAYKIELGDSSVDYYNYTVNDKGWVVSAKVLSQGAGYETRSRLSYTYSNEDSHGNWLRMVIKETTDDNETYTTVHTRKITYWK